MCKTILEDRNDLDEIWKDPEPKNIWGLKMPSYTQKHFQKQCRGPEGTQWDFWEVWNGPGSHIFLDLTEPRELTISGGLKGPWWAMGRSWDLKGSKTETIFGQSVKEPQWTREILRVIERPWAMSPKIEEKWKKKQNDKKIERDGHAPLKKTILKSAWSQPLYQSAQLLL